MSYITRRGICVNIEANETDFSGVLTLRTWIYAMAEMANGGEDLGDRWFTEEVLGLKDRMRYKALGDGS